jgi:HSP20 family protein
MALIRWEPALPPARELHTIQQEMNRLFGTFFDSQAGGDRQGAALRRWIPAMDLVEQGDSYVLRADLPGVREEDVKIELDDDVLTISGERRSEHEERREGYHRVERASGSFSRSLVLPDGVDAQAIRARIEDGVLEVSVPKPARRTPHRVAIASSSKVDVSGKATEATGNGEAKQGSGAASVDRGEDTQASGAQGAAAAA